MGEMAAPLLVLSQNVALLLSLVFLHGLIMPALKRLRPRSGSLLSGALYGLISILGMLTPFRVAPGIIVDGRVVVVALAGVFDGPASGLVAAALVMAFRSWLGGVGTIPGEGAILTASLLGALIHWRWRARVRDFGPKQFLLLGATLAASGMLWTLALPDPLVARRVFRMLAFPVGLGFPVATLLLGTLLSHQLRRREAEEALAKVRQDLEQQVFERTADLSRSNVLLQDEIAERKRAEEALRESEERFRRLSEASFEGIVFHEEGKIIDANEAFATMFGYGLSEVIGKNALDFATPELREAALGHIRGGSEEPYDGVATRKDGSTFPIEARGKNTPYKGRAIRLTAVRDITERKRAEAMLSARTRQLEALRAISVEITRELDLTAVLQLILARAMELVGVSSGGISLWDATAQVLVPRTWHGLGAWVGEVYIRLGEGVAGVVAERREGMIVNDYRTSPYALPAMLEGTGITAVLAEPLLYREWLVGVLILFNMGTERSFAEQDRQILALFAAQAAIAIENARLYEAAQREITERKRVEGALVQRTRQLEAIRVVTAEISRELDIAVLLELINRRAGELVGAISGTVRLWDERAELLIPVAWHGLGDWMKDQCRRLGEGLSGTVAQRREGMIVNNYPTSPYAHPSTLEHTKITAVLAEPLIYRDHFLGVLTVDKHEPGGYFTEGEHEVFRLFAAQAAIAIENARLYQETSRRAEVLERLWQMGQTLGRSLALPATLNRTTQLVRELFQAYAAGLTLWDEATQSLTFAATAGGEGLTWPQMYRPGEGLVGSVAATRRPMVVNDYQAFPHRLPELLTITAAMAVPLLAEDRLISVLVVATAEPGRAFTAEDLQLLELLAQPTAIAIENARLFEQVRTGRERLQSLSHRLVEVQEAERRGIARELHDEIGQLLTGLKLLLDMSTRVRGDAVKVRLGEAQSLTNELMMRVRELSLDLRPAMLDDLGLLPALLWHFERYTAQTNVRVDFQHSGLEKRFAPETETAAYRIVQEALNNVARHAKVAEVAVRLWADENILDLRIEDRGAGFDPEATLSAAASSGLTGMRERAALLGGHLTVTSTPGSGTQVMAELPLAGRFEKRRKPR